jgi:hypothetical protein
MARLDADQALVRQPRQQRRLEPAEVETHLRSLPSLWADAGPDGHQALASALFTKTEVEGYQKLTYELAPDAVEVGPQTALPEVSRLGEFVRGERGSASLTHLSRLPRFVLENVTPAARVWPNEYRRAG